MKVSAGAWASQSRRCSYHGIRERRRDRYRHPPNQAAEEFGASAADQTADKLSVQVGNIQTHHRSQDEEDGVTDDQPELLALPARNDNLEELEEIAEELAVDLDLLLLVAGAVVGSNALPSLLRLARGRGLLLLDGIADAADQRDEESDVDSLGYASAMADVDLDELGDESLDGRLGRQLRRDELGLDGHTGRGLMWYLELGGKAWSCVEEWVVGDGAARCWLRGWSCRS